MEDYADALSNVFGGGKGLALAMYNQAMDPAVRPATRFKIFTQVGKVLADASKMYGDRAKLSSMSTEQIEKRLIALLQKHNFVVPIPGVQLAAGNQSQAEDRTQEAAPPDRADQG